MSATVDSIAHIKQIIYNLHGFEPGIQRMLYFGRVLENEQSLQMANVVKESCLLLVVSDPKVAIVQKISTVENPHVGILQDFFNCPSCNQVYEKHPNDENSHRYLCRQPFCHQSFCSCCGKTPYHTGFTCKQYSLYENAPHCRFCTTMTSTAVCEADECTQLWKVACKKVNACGHYCHGIFSDGTIEVPTVYPEKRVYRVINDTLVYKSFIPDADPIAKVSSGVQLASDLRLVSEDRVQFIRLEYGWCCLDDLAMVETSWVSAVQTTIQHFDAPNLYTRPRRTGPAGKLSQCNECIEPKCLSRSESCCIICKSELWTQPCIVLSLCDHVFHYPCLQKRLETGLASGSALCFTFLDCPCCRNPMYHPSLEPWIAKALDLKLKLARFILKTEPLAKDLSERQKIDYGLTHFVYYQCSSCADIYYSGTRVCHRAAGNDDQPDPDDLLCLKCTGVGNTICVRHGPAYIEYKCNFCCSIATFTCHVYYCAACHSRAGNIGAAPSCAGADSCPLKISHPPNGTKFSLGCGMCRSLARC